MKIWTVNTNLVIFLSKEEKDSKLGDEIVSVMSKYIPSLGNYFFRLYQESLKIDKHSSEKEKNSSKNA